MLCIFNFCLLIILGFEARRPPAVAGCRTAPLRACHALPLRPHPVRAATPPEPVPIAAAGGGRRRSPGRAAAAHTTQDIPTTAPKPLEPEVTNNV